MCLVSRCKNGEKVMENINEAVKSLVTQRVIQLINDEDIEFTLTDSAISAKINKECKFLSINKQLIKKIRKENNIPDRFKRIKSLTCNTCNQTKDFNIANFVPQGEGRIKRECRECQKARKAEYRRRAGVKARENKRKEGDPHYCPGCKETLITNNENFYQSKGGKFYSRCKECIKAESRRRIDNMTEKERKRKNEMALERYYEDRERRIDYVKAYNKKRRKEDPVFRAKRNASKSFKKHLDKIRSKDDETLEKWEHTRKTRDYYGCTSKELIEHIESQFVDGMTWENKGQYGWHIDHIRPLASFDFTGDDMDEQLKAAWHYTNLQPLWWYDNLTKSDKWDEEDSDSIISNNT
jgi:hypothetical protein